MIEITLYSVLRFASRPERAFQRPRSKKRELTRSRLTTQQPEVL